MKRHFIVLTCSFALCLMPSCSQEPQLKTSPQVRVAFQTVKNPAGEMCRDDTLHPVDYINVPFVRFVGSTIELNGAPSSERELLDWAEKKYKNTAEQALWIQVSREDMPRAEHALMPLIQSWPGIDFRLVDPSFTTCPKKRTSN